ncbi:hypothetical protein B296_00014978 [Ensete ventricosum]|uniref:Uncharacterized protein n=1 Tax=Ensete ventricosum TaxID=4639 RepID=A0A426Z4X6_ENSVE|nr:hypothetical protein B296_00014978 [Ensete ventricosum]
MCLDVPGQFEHFIVQLMLDAPQILRLPPRLLGLPPHGLAPLLGVPKCNLQMLHLSPQAFHFNLQIGDLFLRNYHRIRAHARLQLEDLVPENECSSQTAFDDVTCIMNPVGQSSREVKVL